MVGRGRASASPSRSLGRKKELSFRSASRAIYVCSARAAVAAQTGMIRPPGVAVDGQVGRTPATGRGSDGRVGAIVMIRDRKERRDGSAEGFVLEKCLT